MSKVFKTIGTVASVIALIPGPWQAPAMAVALVANVGSALTAKKPKQSPTTTDRLHATFDPNAPRKIVFGRTALPTDVRYQGFTGAAQEYYHQILCVASHQVEAIEELWFDSEMAWSGGGGVVAKFASYLTVAVKLVGTSANTVSIDANWGSSQRLTGCAYLHLRFKLTGVTKKTESPFSQAVPSRVTVRGKGARVPDPRLSTAAGGSGSQDMTDQSTWAYTTAADSGRNPALQLLFYLLGWKIGTKLAVGRGFPASRIDMGSFITAANLCDEAVARVVGGTEPRYRSDGAFSEADDPGLVIGNLCAAMNGILRDAGGKISLDVLHNDLATPVAHFTEDDIVGDELWKQTPPLDQSFNVVRGRYIDPSDASLYQMVDYPEVSIVSPDAIERTESLDLLVVQSSSQAQRLAKTRLQRNQYQGIYSATFNARAWQVSLGNPVTFSHAGLGWVNKLFRVIGHGIVTNGLVPMTLQEENAAIYAWSAEENPAVTPATPTIYDPGLAPILQALDDIDVDTYALAASIAALDAALDGKITTFYGAGTPTAEAAGDLWFKTTDGKWYRASAPGAGSWGAPIEDSDIAIAITAAAGAQATADGKVATFYQDATPTPQGPGDLWTRPSDSPKVLKRWSGTVWETQANNVTQGTDINVANGAPGPDSLNKNSQFSDYPASTGFPPYWSNNQNQSAANTIRVAGRGGPLYAMQVAQTAGVETSCYQQIGSTTEQSINPDQYLMLECDIKLASGVLTGAGLQFEAYSSAFAFISGVNLVFSTSHDTSEATPGAGTVGAEYSFRKLVRVPAGAFFGFFYPRTAYSGYASIATARTIIWRRVALRSATDMEIKAYGVEAGADVTANAQIVVIPPDDVVINANSAGTVLGGQLPMVLAAPTVTKGGVSVRAENTTTYALADVSSSLGTVTVDNTNGSTDKGRVTLPSTGFTGSGAFDLVVTVGGVAQPALHITVTKRNAAPAPPAGGKTGETVIGEGINGTTYVQVGSIMNVTKAAGETIRGALGAHYQWEATTNSSRNAVVKFQTSPAGAGTWTDMGAGVSGTSSDWFQSDFSGNPGSITVNQSATPTDGSYDVRVVASVSASGAGTLTFDGSIAYVTVGV